MNHGENHFNGRNRSPGFYSTAKAYICTAFGLVLEIPDEVRARGQARFEMSLGHFEGPP